MKIKEYFNIQKALHLSDKDKIKLYQRILIKQNSKNLLKRRHFFFAKSFVYNFLLTIVFVWAFWYLLSQNNIVDYWSFLVKLQNPNEVEAWYIGQVLDFEWDFYIEHNWDLFQSKNIANGDTIILKNNTKLVFDIEKSSQAIIKWPAKLILEKFKKDSRYRITLLEWDFIQMKSLDTKNIQNIELSVKWENILVKQQEKNKPINFQLVKQWDKHIVKNNWWNIVVSKILDDEKSTDQVLNKEQVLTIQENDIEVFENLDKFAKAIKEKNISQLFTFDINNIAKEADDNIAHNTDIQNINDIASGSQLAKNSEEETINTILSVSEDEPENTEISRSIKPIISPSTENSSSKKVPTEIQMQKLRTSLVWSFLLSNLEQIYLYQSIWDQDKINSAIYRLETKTKQLYQTFDLTYKWNQSILGIKTALYSLSSELSQKYFIPPTYIDNISILAKWIEKIEVVSFWWQTSVEETRIYRESLKNNKDLIFKRN